MQEARDDELTTYNLARRILTANFVSLHTSSIVCDVGSLLRSVILLGLLDICSCIITLSRDANVRTLAKERG